MSDDSPPPAESAESAAHPLLALVLDFPRLPGVYLMKDEKGQVIYVGKAKDLRARVKSYFTAADERYQVQFLVQRVREIEKIVTAHERQALVLERDLIAKYKPRYNIRLKDDKEFLSIRIDENERWPRLQLVRKREEDGARYFGPYSFSYELRQMLEIIKRTVPLRTCTDSVLYNRQRPCLEYQIKRCAGPCCLPVETAQYRQWVKQAIAILEGRTDSLVKDLRAQMNSASEQLRFEDAAILRDRIELLDNFKSGASFTSSRGEVRDVIGLYREERLVTLALLKVRNGRVVDSNSYALSEVEVSDSEVLEQALLQFYNRGREIPEQIFLPIAIEEDDFTAQLLSERAEHAVALTVPERGVGARLLELAQINAQEHFRTIFDSEKRYLETAKKLALTLKLSQIPRRIECVDISNFQGSDTVGAIVSFFDGEPDKSRYKKYQIDGTGTPDDFGAILEVVGRRLEQGRADGDLPDLLVIDGGKGQLTMALEARDTLEVNIEIVALAKMRVTSAVQSAEINKTPERVFLPGVDEPVILTEGEQVTSLLQRIRDEVHRFVITFHRNKRSKRAISSILDTIPGIGAERRKRLLKEFGSVEEIRHRSADEIAKVGRMPKALAEKLLGAITEAQ